MEALMTRVKLQMALTSQTKANRALVKNIFEDFIPTNDPESIELQNLAAVIECTSRNLLPGRYAEMDRSEIRRKFDELRNLV